LLLHTRIVLSNKCALQFALVTFQTTLYTWPENSQAQPGNMLLNTPKQDSFVQGCARHFPPICVPGNPVHLVRKKITPSSRKHVIDCTEVFKAMLYGWLGNCQPQPGNMSVDYLQHKIVLSNDALASPHPLWGLSNMEGEPLFCISVSVSLCISLYLSVSVSVSLYLYLSVSVSMYLCTCTSIEVRRHLLGVRD
jgi:hypothetical protein